MPKINRRNCLPPIATLCTGAPLEEELPDNWLSELKTLWSSILKLKHENAETLHTDIERHCGDEATHSTKKYLLIHLYNIYIHLADRSIRKLDSQKKNSLLLTLEHPVSMCTAGFVNIVTSQSKLLQAPQSINHLLLRTRTEIIDSFARSHALEIHGHNVIFKWAQELGFSVFLPDDHDPFSHHPFSIPDGQLRAMLDREFAYRYQPFEIISNLRSQIRDILSNEFGYTGLVDKYAANYYDNFIEYLTKILNIQDHARFQEDVLILNDSGEVSDLNWPCITYLLFQKLHLEEYLEFTPEEAAFITSFLVEETIVAFPKTIFNNPKEFSFFLKICPETTVERQYQLSLELTRAFPKNILAIIINCLDVFANYPFILQKFKEHHASTPFTQPLIEKMSNDKTYFHQLLEQGSFSQKHLVQCLQFMTQEQQIKVFSTQDKNGVNPLIFLAVNKPYLLNLIFDYIQEFPSDKQQSVLSLCEYTEGKDLLKLIICSQSHALLNIVRLLKKSPQILQSLWVSSSHNDCNALMLAIAKDPMLITDKSVRNLKFILQEIEQNPFLDSILLQQENRYGFNSLMLAMSEPLQLAFPEIVSFLYNKPSSLIFSILSQETKHRFNALSMSCHEPYKKYANGLCALMHKLSPFEQVSLLSQKDTKGNTTLMQLASIHETPNTLLIDILKSFSTSDLIALFNQRLCIDDETRNALLFTKLNTNQENTLMLAIKEHHDAVLPLLDILESFSDIDEVLKVLAMRNSDGETCLTLALEYPSPISKDILELHLRSDEIELDDIWFKKPDYLRRSLALLNEFDSSILENNIHYFIRSMTLPQEHIKELLDIAFELLEQQPNTRFVFALINSLRIYVIEDCREYETSEEIDFFVQYLTEKIDAKPDGFVRFTPLLVHFINDTENPECTHPLLQWTFSGHQTTENKMSLLKHCDDSGENILMANVSNACFFAIFDEISNLDIATQGAIFSQENAYKQNVLHLALLAKKEGIEYLISKISTLNHDDKFKIFTQITDENEGDAHYNCIQYALKYYPRCTLYLIRFLQSLQIEDEFYLEPNGNGSENILMLAHNTEYLKMLMSNIPETALKKLLLDTDGDDYNTLEWSIWKGPEFTQVIMEKVDSLQTPLSLEEQLDFYRLDPCSSNIHSLSLLHFICENSTAEFHPILGKIYDLVKSRKKLLHIFTDGDGDHDNPLMVACQRSKNIQPLLEVLKKLPMKILTEVLTTSNNNGENALLVALKDDAEHAPMLMDFISQLPEELQAVIWTEQDNEGAVCLKRVDIYHSELLPTLISHLLRTSDETKLSLLSKDSEREEDSILMYWVEHSILSTIFPLINSLPEHNQQELLIDPALFIYGIGSPGNIQLLTEKISPWGHHAINDSLSGNVLHVAASQNTESLKIILRYLRCLDKKNQVALLIEQDEDDCQPLAIACKQDLENTLLVLDNILEFDISDQQKLLSSFTWNDVIVSRLSGFLEWLSAKNPDSKCFLIPEDAIAITLSQGNAEDLTKLLQCIENVCPEKKAELIENCQLTVEKARIPPELQEFIASTLGNTSNKRTTSQFEEEPSIAVVSMFNELKKSKTSHSQESSSQPGPK